MDSDVTANVPQHCSFCGADPERVEHLFVSQSAAICERCIRTLAAEEAVSLTEDVISSNRLVGRWTRTTGKDLSVSLEFAKDGTLRSTTTDESGVTNRFLRYALNGSELSTVELISCGERQTSTIEIAGNVLTLRSKIGESVFRREDSDL